jgi:phosphatidylglycerophosphatase A
MTSLPPLHPARVLATWFGVGHWPGPTGTWGSLAALPFAWAIVEIFGASGLLIASALALSVGIWAASAYTASSYRKDPGAVVIDEVAGQWTTLALGAFVGPLAPWSYAVGFLLFRAADIRKPWPASWADRELSGAVGIMLDDIFAGVFAGIGLAVLIWLVG